MLKLNASYSKKLPVPGQEFSSQNYHASIELELSDALSPEDLRNRIHDTFAMVRDAVETELGGTPRETARPEQAGPVATRQAPTQPAGKASNKQIKFITDLAQSHPRRIPPSPSRPENRGMSSSYVLTRPPRTGNVVAGRGEHQQFCGCIRRGH